MTTALVASVAMASVTMGAAMPSIDKAEVRAAVQSLKELTEAVPVVAPRDEPNVDGYLRERQRLEALAGYLEKFGERFFQNQVMEAELFNYLQVCRDLVDAGVRVSRLPREAPAWYRAMIRLTKAVSRIAARHIEAKRWQPHVTRQIAAQLELLERQLQAAREKTRVHTPNQFAGLLHFRV